MAGRERKKTVKGAVVVLWEREMGANRGAAKGEGLIFDSIWLPGSLVA